jgi:hypothetical protein
MDYNVVVPNGTVLDLEQNSFTGVSLCSGCDWPFRTAKSQAPTIVNSPGAACNNTLVPGEVAVTPSVDSLVNGGRSSLSLSQISFRWCAPFTSTYSTVSVTTFNATSSEFVTEQVQKENRTYHAGPTPYTSGIISIATADEPDTVLFSIDLSKPEDRARLIPKSVMTGNDEYSFALPRGTLSYWDTKYIVKLDEGTFYSYTNEPSVRYEWPFSTGVKPPDLNRVALDPPNGATLDNIEHVINGTQHFGGFDFSNEFGFSTIAILFDDKVVLGTGGQVCLYSNDGSISNSDFEKQLCSDVTSGQISQYATAATSRRSWDAKPLRRGVLQVDRTHNCPGGCMWTSGNYLFMQVPTSAMVMKQNHLYRGSMDDCAVTSLQGACGPQTSPADWQFTTATLAAIMNSPPSNAASVCDSWYCDFDWMLFFLILLLVILLCCPLIWFMCCRKKEKRDRLGTDENFTDEEFESLFINVGYGGPNGGAIGDVHGNSQKAHPRKGPGSVAHCDTVDKLNVAVPAIITAMAIPDKTIRDDALRKILMTDVKGSHKHNPIRRPTPGPISGDTLDPGLGPGGIPDLAGAEDPMNADLSMVQDFTEVNFTLPGPDNSSDDILERDLNAIDIQAAARSIEACEDYINPSVETDHWKLKADLMQGNLVNQKLTVRLGEPMPRHAELMSRVWRDAIVQRIKDPADTADGDRIQILIAQAWPEITRLELERISKRDNELLMDAMQKVTAGTLPEQEIIPLCFQKGRAADELKANAMNLDAAAQVTSLLPIFFDRQTLDPPEEYDEELFQTFEDWGGFYWDPDADGDAVLSPIGEASQLEDASKLNGASKADGPDGLASGMERLESPEGSPSTDSGAIDEAAIEMDMLGALAPASNIPNLSTKDSVGKKDEEVTQEFITWDFSLPAEEQLQHAEEVHGKFYDFMHQVAKPMFMMPELEAGGITEALHSAVKRVEDTLTDDDLEDALKPEQVQELENIIGDLAPQMMKMQARNPTIAGALLEQLLVAADKVVNGDSSGKFLQAIVTDVQPQVEMLEQLTGEVTVTAAVLEDMNDILKSTDEALDKVKQLARLLGKHAAKIKDSALSHKKRFKASQVFIPSLSKTAKEPPTRAAELAALAEAIDIAEDCKGKSSGEAQLASIAAAHARVVQLHKPTHITPEGVELFSNALVSMEKFAFGEIDIAEMDLEIEKARGVLEDYWKDKRIKIVDLMTAFDCAKLISSHISEKPTFYSDNMKIELPGDDEGKGSGPEIQTKFKDDVSSAWGDIVTLQSEMKCNEILKDLVSLLSVVDSDDHEERLSVPLDEFEVQISNMRTVLKDLLQHDKQQYCEARIVHALSGLTNIHDAEKINIATREAKEQMAQLVAEQSSLDALKDVYDVFKVVLDMPDDERSDSLVQDFENWGTFALQDDAQKKMLKHVESLHADHLEDSMAGLSRAPSKISRDELDEKCRELVQQYSSVIIHVGAVNDNAEPIRSCLLAAAQIQFGARIDQKFKARLQVLIDTVIRPRVMRSCSGDDPEELKELLEMVQKVVDDQLHATTLFKQVEAQHAVASAYQKVRTVLADHRERLAFRRRMEIQTHVTPAKLKLRDAPPPKGAEWIGFNLNDSANSSEVHLRHRRKSKNKPKSSAQAAFEAADISGDGKITYDEAWKWIFSIPGDTRPKKLRKYNSTNKVLIKKLMKKYDTDGDKALELKEFEAFWEDMQD